ncbi:flagellar biosynthesis anti-sigma factor FlgM [Rhodanobacter aciditrophus]|uniref:flagellar biosynthesis anti-sigma factor FlgM n=1 Tax=Rhodanobacter aciditrophus TaxID=1623218 RepID=UPI003CEA0FDB
MNTTISNNGLPKLQPAAGQPGSGTTAESAGTAGAGTPAAKADDQLRLTDSAKALQQAARADAAAVDPRRVERVRQALADGSYKIDAGRVADRMIAMERQLGGTGKA